MLFAGTNIGVQEVDKNAGTVMCMAGTLPYGSAAFNYKLKTTGQVCPKLSIIVSSCNHNCPLSINF